MFLCELILSDCLGMWSTLSLYGQNILINGAMQDSLILGMTLSGWMLFKNVDAKTCKKTPMLFFYLNYELIVVAKQHSNLQNVHRICSTGVYLSAAALNLKLNNYIFQSETVLDEHTHFLSLIRKKINIYFYLQYLSAP